MGYQLRRQLRTVLGPDITGLQRAVALEIADDANDATRESWAKLEDLALWTAAKDTNVIRNALKRLAAAGWEFRVPMGKGKDGRLLYAVPGRKLTFRVPSVKGVAVATPFAPKGKSRHLPSEPRLPLGVAPAPSEGALATPFSSSPQEIPSSPLSPAARIVRDSGLVAEDERESFLAWINHNHKTPGVGWWRTVARNGDLAAQVDQWRAWRSEPTDVFSDMARERRMAIDACSRCDDNGLTDEDRPRRCDHQPTQEIADELSGESRPRNVLTLSVGQAMPPVYGRQR